MNKIAKRDKTTENERKSSKKRKRKKKENRKRKRQRQKIDKNIIKTMLGIYNAAETGAMKLV